MKALFTETEIESLARIDSRESALRDELPPADVIAIMRASNGSPKLASDLASNLESEEGEDFQYTGTPLWWPVDQEENEA